MTPKKFLRKTLPRKSVKLGFCFILVPSNTVIWASLFGTHIFYFPCCIILQGNFHKLWHGNSCFTFRKKALAFTFFLILFLSSTQLFKVWLKRSQFVFFYFHVTCNCSNLLKQEVKHSYYNLSINREKYQLDLSKLLML